MTGLPQYNYPAFESAQRFLSELGAQEVFSPAENDIISGFDPTVCHGKETKDELADLGFNLREALADDLGWIASSADAVAVLPGFENSKGVAAELALAAALSLKVFYLRNHPDGSWYLRDTAEGIGPRKVESDPAMIPILEGQPRFAESSRYQARKAESDQSAIDKGLIKPFGETMLGKLLADPGSDWGKTSLASRSLVAAISDPVMATTTDLNTSTSLPNNYKNGEEVRLTSETGGQKGSKPERYDLIPTGPLAHLARTYGFGALKYEDNNWQKGYDWKLSYAALQRHLNAFWSGEDMDPEIGTPHLANAAWHCFTLMWFMENKPEYDSRSKS